MDERKMAEVEAMAGALGNVLEACRSCGVSRSLFYKWLRVRQAGAVVGGGGEGSADARPAAKGMRRRHPHALPEGLLPRVLELARAYPEWGCDRISHYLKLQGSKISPTTIQKILTRNGLRTRQEREAARAPDFQTNSLGRVPRP